MEANTVDEFFYFVEIVHSTKYQRASLGKMMAKASSVSREGLVKMYGSVWLADDTAGQLLEHLGPRKTGLHFGDYFSELATAIASRPDYEVVYLQPKLNLSGLTPMPRPRNGNKLPIPREVYIVEFDDLFTKGLRIVNAQINSVEFESPPVHLLGIVDFVASAVMAGNANQYRVRIEYDGNLSPNIVENPQIWTSRGFVVSNQVMAFFSEEEAVREADKFAASLKHAANWRSRSDLIKET